MFFAQAETALEAGKALAEAQTLGQFQQAAILLLLVLLAGTVALLLKTMEARRKEGLKRELRVTRALEALAGIQFEESSNGE